MAKENEKKVSREMNEEELENVAGGACSSTGTVASSKLVSGVKMCKTKTGGRGLMTTYFGNHRVFTMLDAQGNPSESYSLDDPQIRDIVDTMIAD